MRKKNLKGVEVSLEDVERELGPQSTWRSAGKMTAKIGCQASIRCKRCNSGWTISVTLAADPNGGPVQIEPFLPEGWGTHEGDVYCCDCRQRVRRGGVDHV